MKDKKKAVVLSSGGIDSTTVMAIAKQEGFEIFSLSFFYEQRHSFEIEAARKVAEAMGVKKHLILDIDLKKIGGSALTDNNIDVPKRRNSSSISEEIPATYVPARNTIFLSYALAWSEVLNSSDIFIGVNAIDYSGYPDCRPEYIEAFEKMANLATKAGVEGRIKLKIRTPLISMTKAEIIKKGLELGVDYSLTRSCYDPSSDNLACGQCDSCLLRKQGFEDAGIIDPTEYII
ncbi:MAG: 7-cyano-7-deazaguanine synthase QueC [Proteobacteria bacterium]|nr:7-cyano-7-deazaguanine synthase QueC [Pseudomonadota bacterium]MBU4259510.1 7-cyano-7-deazaguanine synthase QueC [Pseudomonadota bacterium]MBU4289193.1 7-cyano-7-deazaguanine synthase QueC [Pseudomonadota bacterium]MCG2758453.1 7-cyano-7-deazaguanine synthase QueC [Desulfobacteraceae bacterium]